MAYWAWMGGLAAVMLLIEWTCPERENVLSAAALVSLIALFAVTARRLRDADLSQWMLLLFALAPLGYVVLILACLAPTRSAARSGPRLPLAAEEGTSESGGDRFEDARGLRSGDVVFFVHGTFARNATWIDKGGAFAEELRRSGADLHFESFRWSGRNSPDARILAGLSLAERGAQLYAEGHRRFWIVCHSHGGNVALYALRSAVMREATRGICFLGTPFFEPRRRPIQAFSKIVGHLVSWLILFPGILPFGVMRLATWIGAFSPALGYLTTILGGGLLAGAYLIKFRPLVRRYACEKTYEILKELQDEAYTRLATPAATCPTLVAYVDNDEAGLLLRWLDRISVAPWRIFGYLLRFLGVVTFACLAAEIIPLLIYDDGTITKLDDSVSPMILATTLALSLLIAGPLIALLATLVRGTPVAFGYEGIAAGATVHFEPRSTPSGWNGVPPSELLAAVPPTLKGLRHSMFYQDARIIAACTRWMLDDAECIDPDVAQTPAGGAGRRWQQWMVSLSIAAAIIGVQLWHLSRTVERLAQPQFDNEKASVPSDVPKQGREVFRIDQQMEGFERTFVHDSPKATTLVSDSALSPNSKCRIQGDLEFGNWGSGVHLSLSDPSEPSKPWSSVWHWRSNMGKTISFSRNIENPFAHDAQLQLQMWNDGHDPASIKGTVTLACA